MAEKAVDHLRWRDPLGLLGTALALAEAAHTACGRFSAAAGYAEQIPEASQLDPKVAMLRAWAEAWREQEAGRRTHAADIIAAAARALQDLHHVFYAGMLAHCAARSGYPAKVLDVLEEAARAGGGVLDLFLAHARAIDEGDDEELARIVEEFDALGMQATAVDGAALLARRARRAGRVIEARRWEWRAHQSLPAEMDVSLWLHEKRGEVQLSPREREVALFAARRLSSREIAARLGVSEKTVSNQLGSVYRKLGVSGRAELRELLEEEIG